MHALGEVLGDSDDGVEKAQSGQYGSVKNVHPSHPSSFFHLDLSLDLRLLEAKVIAWIRGVDADERMPASSAGQYVDIKFREALTALAGLPRPNMYRTLLAVTLFRKLCSDGGRWSDLLSLFLGEFMDAIFADRSHDAALGPVGHKPWFMLVHKMQVWEGSNRFACN
jgi:hypothetical protein